MRTGTLIRTAIVTVTAALTVTLVPHDAYARPHDPGDAAISAAQQDRNKKAADVGRLTALVAKADGDASRAQDLAELAVERYNKAVVDLGTATAKASAAKAQVTKSAKAVDAARADFAAFARRSYMQGSTVNSATAALMDADSPTDLLSYAGKHKLDVMGQLERATVKRANAESTARQLLAAQKAATARAEALKIAAAREVAAARAALASLQTQKATLSQQLEDARIKLNGLYAERARYRAWKKAQEEAAAREAARQRALRAAAAAREAAEAAAAARAARSSSARESSSSDSSGSSAPSVSVSRWTGGGGWSASKGRRVADLAMQWLGTPYSWGGGNSSGPTWGTDGPVGFDCSGLALWAWAQVGVPLPHYSGYQYRSGVHISRGNLMPGDLVFWAYDPSDPSSIHHVAIYIGGGRIVQAPQTGDVVKISFMWSTGYIGAARPGT